MGATAAVVMTAVGVGVSAYGSVKAGSANKAISYANADAIDKTTELNAKLIEEGIEVNAGVLEWNARMAEGQARDAIRRGKEEEGIFRKGIRGLIGAQRADYAGQGVDVSSGSALDVQADTAYQGEMDAITLRVNAAREAWGFRVDAEESRIQAAALRKSGKLEAKNTRDVGRANARSARMGGNFAAQAGTLNAASTIIGGGGSLLYQKYGYGRK